MVRWMVGRLMFRVVRLLWRMLRRLF